MHLSLRLLRALTVFGMIFTSYMVQLGLGRVFGKVDPRGYRQLPPWLARRRQRVDAKNADRLLAGMLRLRGVYIKLGQVLSIMGGFLPKVYGKRLEQLQDQVPPQPFDVMFQAFTESFGQPPEALFRDIDRAPIAAASLGQVHAAHLKDGRKVAVKILYPGIRDVIAVDMRVLRLAVFVYKRFVPVTGIERIHSSLVDLLHRETDYLHEAMCMERMADNFAGEPDIAFPEVIVDLTTRDILTMTFMEGTKITKLDELRAAGVDTDEIAKQLVRSFYKMLFADRFFHADPHPGNFLVMPPAGDRPARLVVLDFGAICEAREELIEGMLEILEGLFTQNDAKVLAGFRRMGFVTEGGDDALIEKTVKSYFGKLLKIEDRSPDALLKTKARELQALADPELERDELQALMRSFEYPEDWFYVERACVLMFWLAAQIDPKLDTIAVGFPYVMPLIAERATRAAGSVA